MKGHTNSEQNTAETVISEQISRSKSIASGNFRKMITCRECPVLQDIDGDVATLLTHEGLLPTEEIVIALTDFIDIDTVRSCRTQLFDLAVGQLHESLSDADHSQTLVLRLKSRRGNNAHAAYARDLVELFHYICGISASFPQDALTSPCPMLMSSVMTTTVLPRTTNSVGTIADTCCPLNDAISDTDKLKNTTIKGSDACPDNQSICTQGSDEGSINLTLDSEYPTPAQRVDEENILIKTPDPSNKNRPYCPIESNMTLSGIETLPPTGHTDAATLHDEPVEGSVVITDGSELEGNAFPITPDPSQGNTSSTSNVIYSSPKQSTPKTNQSKRRNTPVGKGPNHLSEICNAVDAILVELCAVKENYTTLEKRVSVLETQEIERNLSIKNDIKHLTHQVEKMCSTVNTIKSQLGSNAISTCTASTNTGETGATSVPNIPCHNRYAVLRDETSSPDIYDAVSTDETRRCHSSTGNPPVPRPQPSSSKNKAGQPATTQQKRRRPNVSIVGSSLVRGLGKALNDDGYDVCCFTNPGGTIESTMPRIPDMTREDDDIIVLAVGSNNIPNDDVPTMIQKAGKMVDQIQMKRPNADIIIPGIPRRYDHPDPSDTYMDKMQRVNVFLQHRCRKHRKLHFLKHNFNFLDYKPDGLHFNETGVGKYARNIRSVVNKILANR